MSQTRTLREGFTTGTAASAAAHAAVRLLLGGFLPEQVSVALPPVPEAHSLTIAIACGERFQSERPAGRGAFATVIKDGGDDPDATHGARITAYASLFPPERDAMRNAARPEAIPGPGIPLPLPGYADTLMLYGGQGIGIATLPGLPLLPGEPAINPEPRKQIAAAVGSAAALHGYTGSLHIVLSVAEGEQRARRTLNPRLGIQGGISILGTRGIVRPYSHEAWQATIEQSLDVAHALGIQHVLLTTGRRSERLALLAYPGLPPQAAVQAADYAAFSIRNAARRGFSRITWACFPGKLVKLAQGLEWTHAKAADTDSTLLAEAWLTSGGDAATAASACAIPTAVGAFGLFHAVDPDKALAALRMLAQSARRILCEWARQAGGNSCAVHLHVFSLAEQSLLTLPDTEE